MMGHWLSVLCFVCSAWADPPPPKPIVLKCGRTTIVCGEGQDRVICGGREILCGGR